MTRGAALQRALEGADISTVPIAVTPAPPARRSSRSRRNPRYVDAASVFGLLLTLVTLAAAVRSIAHLLS